MDTNDQVWELSTDTLAGPPAPPPSMIQNWIVINWQVFVQTAVPGQIHAPRWALGEEPFEALYQSALGPDGQLLCTQRMASWLRDLPEMSRATSPAGVPSIQEPIARSWNFRALLGGRRDPHTVPNQRFPIIGNPIPSPLGQRTRAMIFEPVPTDVPGMPEMADIVHITEHPNPLGQHPVEREEIMVQPHIPKRQSSLFFQQEGSQHPINPTTSVARHNAAEENVMQGVQALQLNDRLETGDLAPDETGHITDVPRCPIATERFHESNPKAQARKRCRSLIRTATMASQQPPSKRLKRTLTSARNRLSRVMTPAGIDDAPPTRRQSRVDVMTEAAKRMSLSAPPQMIKVTGFGLGVAKERVKIAFVGNTGVGKTTFIRAFVNEKYDEQAIAAPTKQFSLGYEVDTLNVVIDGVPVSCETWDVSSQCDEKDFEVNAIRPLLMTFYDVVVICHDVSDETSLQAAEAKWAHDAGLYCFGSPTMLLGLKADLRKPLPSLRLMHLMEPTQTSRGQGEHAAKKMGVEAHFEASAKTGEGVTQFFETAIRFALQRRRSRQQEVFGPVLRAKKAWKGIKKHLS